MSEWASSVMESDDQLVNRKLTAVHHLHYFELFCSLSLQTGIPQGFLRVIKVQDVWHRSPADSLAALYTLVTIFDHIDSHKECEPL